MQLFLLQILEFKVGKKSPLCHSRCWETRPEQALFFILLCSVCWFPELCYFVKCTLSLWLHANKLYLCFFNFSYYSHWGCVFSYKPPKVLYTNRNWVYQISRSIMSNGYWAFKPMKVTTVSSQLDEEVTNKVYRTDSSV